MAYIALYRKYRSQSFDELMGQAHVTQTLQNAIASNKIAHAYLFHGARGCGKTSTARLLARALNCENGPTPTPCGTCRLCVSIREGTCLDVVEIDAASETSIDDVREKIIENVQYAPAEARYKVYIIDEVHDLSAKAFDALLKTLEEPPAHVIFILATTELHKVPITIRSRCQKHQFKRGTLQDLATSIQRVITAEGYTAEPEAVQALARAAEGSWRDALSLLEQVLAYSGPTITAETVHSAVGTVGTDTLARVTEILALGRWDTTFAIASELIETGTDVRQLITSLSAHLRDLLLIASGATQTARQELGEDRFALLSEQAKLFTPSALLAMMSVLSAAERELRFTNQHRVLLETTLLRMLPESLASRDSVVEKRDIAPARQAQPNPPPTPSAMPLAMTPAVVPKPSSTPPVRATNLVVESYEEEEPEPETAPVRPHLVTVSDSPLPAAVTEATPEEKPDYSDRFAEGVTFDVVRRAWPRILKLFQKASPSGAPWLEKAEVLGLEGTTVVLGFRDSFARDRIQNNAKGRAKVEEKINEGLNTNGLKIRCEMLGEGDGGINRAPKSPDDSPPGNPLTLLDAPPPVAPTQTARSMMDFAMPPPEETKVGTNYGSAEPAEPMDKPAVPEAVSRPLPAPKPPPAKPESNGLLAETLTIFGGEVVSSEGR